VSKIKKATDAKKIATAIAKAKEKFPEVCVAGNKIGVELHNHFTLIDYSEIMEEGVANQIETTATHLNGKGYISYLALDSDGNLSVAQLLVEVVNS